MNIAEMKTAIINAHQAQERSCTYNAGVLTREELIDMAVWVYDMEWNLVALPFAEILVVFGPRQ